MTSFQNFVLGNYNKLEKLAENKFGLIVHFSTNVYLTVGFDLHMYKEYKNYSVQICISFNGSLLNVFKMDTKKRKYHNNSSSKRSKLSYLNMFLD